MKYREGLRKRIKQKIFVVGAALAVFFSLAFGSILYDIEKQSIEREVKRVSNLVKKLDMDALFLIRSLDTEEALSTDSDPLKFLLSRKGVIGAGLYTDKGHYIEVKGDLASSGWFIHQIVSEPVSTGGDSTLAIHANVDMLSVFISDIQGIIVSLIATLLAGVVGAAMLSETIAKRIAQSIEHLAQEVRTRIQNKEFKSKIELPDHYEYELRNFADLYHSIAQDFYKLQLDLKKAEEEKDLEVVMATQELRLQHNEAQEMLLAKDLFVGSMSHEIRQPLQALMFKLEYADDVIKDNEARKHIKSAMSVAQTVHQIINNAIDYTGLRSKKIEFNQDRFSLIDAIDDIGEQYREAAFRKEIDYSIDVSILDEDFIIEGDKTRFKQIISNLVGNAIKFTAKNGKIILSASSSIEKGSIRRFHISVSDNGCGMDEAGKKRAVELYRQADNVSAANASGSGLGLPLSIMLAEAMGGQITIESELNEGTTAHLDIPMRVLSQRDRTIRNENNEPIAILLISSNQVHTRRLEEVFMHLDAHYQIYSHRQIDETPSLIYGERFDLAMVDTSVAISEYVISSIKALNEEGAAVIELTNNYESDRPLLNAQINSSAAVLPILTREIESEIMSTLGLGELQNKTIDFNGKILIVDDIDTNRSAIKYSLQKILVGSDCTYLEADDGDVAIEQYQEHQPDIIFMDLRMPRVEGLQATADIRKFEMQQGITPAFIVASTADALKQSGLSSEKNGMNAHIMKPISKHDLIKVLDMAREAQVNGFAG